MTNRGLIIILGDLLQQTPAFQQRFCFQKLEEAQLKEKLLEELAPDLLVLCAGQTETPVETLLTTVKESTRVGEVPVLILDTVCHPELESAVLKSGAIDYVVLPCPDDVLLWRMVRVVDLYREHQGLRKELTSKERELERLSMQTLSAIANLVDSKDRHLKGHSMRVAEYACALAAKLNKSEKEIKDIYYIGMLHDIGNIGIPDTVFSKAGKLTESEYSLVKQHTVVGQKLLQDITMIPAASQVAGYHHERVDGTGYHEGLKGEEIPLYARIINIADAYDAMSTERAYRGRLSPEEIRRELESGRGEQFDSQLVDLMLELMEEGFEPQIAKRMENFTISSLAEEGNALLQKLFLEYTEEIKDISHRDGLTGLWNRAYLENQVNAFLRTRRHTGTFMMLDLDNFKTINDTYGHMAGDRLLIQFGAILKRMSREEDIVCRFGGDEFAVFLKDLDDEAVIRRKAELYIRALREEILEPCNYRETSVSIGIAVAPQHGNSFVELYQKADQAMYDVKQHGKNGYRLYDVFLADVEP